MSWVFLATVCLIPFLDLKLNVLARSSSQRAPETCLLLPHNAGVTGTLTISGFF